MAANSLTEEQRAKVEKNRLGQPPTYYNSTTGGRQGINQDTEAAIILLAPEKREKATKYFKLFGDREASSSDYQKVFDLFFERQQNNLKIANTSLQSIFTQFNQFRDDLLGSGEDVLVTGLQPVFESLNLGMGNLKSTYDTLQYRERHFTAAKNIGVATVTDEQRREIKSWVPVFVIYPY